MAKVYVTRCIVKKDGKRYEKGSVIENLSGDEIKKGLAEKWLEAVGNDKEPAKEESVKPKGKPKDSKNKGSGKATGEVEPSGKTREELFEEAAALGIAQTITEATTAEEIQKLIEEAQQ